MKAVKQMANPWAIHEYQEADIENTIERIEGICKLKDIIAFDLSWKFKDTDKRWQEDGLKESVDFIGEAKAYIGDSQEQITQQFIKMDFDYIIDEGQMRGEASIKGTIWVADGTWINIITVNEYSDYDHNHHASVRYNRYKAPTPPSRD
jgi:hypothetical protein